MYHLVYKITNEKNGKYYIGIHSTKKIEDGYMGSGILLREEIKKTGAEHFNREILHIKDSRKEALEIERGLVSVKTLADPMCYNLVCGGGGSATAKIIPFQRYNENVYYEFRIKEAFFYKNLVGGFLKALTPKLVIDVLNKGYNDLQVNTEASKFLEDLKTKLGYSNNIVCIERNWL